MKKFAFLLLMTSINLHPSPLTQKARAYLKIGYGITSLLAGIGSPIMGAYHFAAGQALAKIDGAADLLRDNANATIQGFRLFQKLKTFHGVSRLTSLAGTAEKVFDKGMDSQIALQNVSGGFYLFSPFFFIPLGVAAIKSGREDLKALRTEAKGGHSGQMKIASDKA
jgi:hypothetical protein